jgi:hypothetical protein
MSIRLLAKYLLIWFWKNAASASFIIPVAMGGKTIDCYRLYYRRCTAKLCLHVENFFSSLNLADNLKSVASDMNLFSTDHEKSYNPY